MIPIPTRSIGSSPRMRGTRKLSAGKHMAARFIPAHAGNTQSALTCVPPPPVHPRACGEHECYLHYCNFLFGSSPRMRGTQRRTLLRRYNLRFIPAHAGNTWTRQQRRCRRPVHPRACGEHFPEHGCVWVLCGSSPRMRGTLRRVELQVVEARFIPAHAGNTLHPDRPVYVTSVHPRACGEHDPFGPTGFNPVGSSPRMRGTQTRVRRRLGRFRFIPAHAGNTQLWQPNST